MRLFFKKKYLKFIVLFNLVILQILLLFSFSLAATLYWEPVESTQDCIIAGYKVHYGPEPGDYSHVIDVQDITYFDLDNLVLEPSSTYYFAVSAYSIAGQEGQLSMPIPYTCKDLPALNTYYRDSDNDGYGNTNNTTKAVSQPYGYVSNNIDCNDADNTIYPGATELPGDDIDQDCDGQDLLALNTYYRDSDNDGYGDPDNSVNSVNQPYGYVSNNADSNDTDNTVYPGATEDTLPVPKTKPASIAKLWQVDSTVVGDTVTLWAKVENTGTEVLPLDARIWFWVDGPDWEGSHWIESTELLNKNPATSTWYSIEWIIPESFSAGTYRYWVQAWTSTEAISDWSQQQNFEVTQNDVAISFNSDPEFSDNSFADFFTDNHGKTEWFRLWVGNESGTQGSFVDTSAFSRYGRGWILKNNLQELEVKNIPLNATHLWVGCWDQNTGQTTWYCGSVQF